jgi:integrase/recombinase XerD
MAKRAKAPPGCYWRGSALWGQTMVNGRREQWPLDTSDPAIARKRQEAGKARLLADAKHGDAKRSLEETTVAWEGHLTRQVANGVLGQKTKTRYLVSIGQLAPFLEGRALTDIDMRFLGGLVEGREKVVTNATIKRDLVALSSMMNFALDKGWVEQNPVLIKLPRVKEGKHTIEPPRREDIDLALSRAPGMLGPLARLAMATGARLDELVTLKREQIDHARQQLVIVGKGAKRRVVDLRVMNAYALIAALPVYVGSPFLFWHDKGEPYRNASSNFANNVTNATVEWAKANGVEFRSFRFHDLRHWHAIEFLKAGWGTIYDLKQRLGHASLTTTEIYLSGEFLTEEEKNAAKDGRAVEARAVARRGAV